MILSDNETKVDLLNAEPIARTIVGLLIKHAGTPITIGVHGDWGAGKSSILEMIHEQLENRENTLCLKFNGWRFQGFEDAKIALVEGIVTGLVEKRPAVRKIGAALQSVLKRLNVLKVAKRLTGLGLTVATAHYAPALAPLVATAALSDEIQKDAASEATKALTTLPEEAFDASAEPRISEQIEEFRKDFDRLLREAGIEHLVVLIDDLDRCLPDVAIETLEALRLLVFTNRTAFVVAADEAMIEYAVRRHFPDLPETSGPRDYARNYLEKLIQVPFRIPALGTNETKIYVTLLLVGERLGSNRTEFENLIVVAREHLREPWLAKPLDEATIRTSLGSAYTEAADALRLSNQIAPSLAAGTQGNPRQIKRFLNTLLLRQEIAKARGFGALIKPPILAKLMLAERFEPLLFDQIAVAAAADDGGLCKSLQELETAIVRESQSTSASRRSTGSESRTPEPPTQLVATWLASQQIRSWAQIEPALGHVDLRPYLFVSKDKKNYFGGASALGPLAILVDQLMGSKFSVQGLQARLRGLTAAEAAQVFDALRTRVSMVEDLSVTPAGVDGLTVLVKTKSELQGHLLDLLESLPVDKLGPWATKGWSGVFTDLNRARFANLLQRWVSSANDVLKHAASAAVQALSREG